MPFLEVSTFFNEKFWQVMGPLFGSAGAQKYPKSW